MGGVEQDDSERCKNCLLVGGEADERYADHEIKLISNDADYFSLG
jgi:hypothetical protein